MKNDTSDFLSRKFDDEGLVSSKKWNMTGVVGSFQCGIRPVKVVVGQMFLALL